MAQIKNYPKLALEILKEINGKENIINISRCATRLRLILKETPNDLKERIESLTGVITTVEKRWTISNSNRYKCWKSIR